MKKLGSEEVIAASIGAFLGFVFSIIVSWLTGEIDSKALLAVFIIVVLVALLVFIFMRGGWQTTSYAALVGISSGFLIFLIIQGPLKTVTDPATVAGNPDGVTASPDTVPTSSPTITSVPKEAPTASPTPTEVPPTNTPTIAPIPTPIPEVTVEQLNDKKVVLTGPTASENYKQQVVTWFNTDPGYQKLSKLILETLGDKQFVKPVHLDTINGKYKSKFGLSGGQGLSTDQYNDQEKLKSAILEHWNEQEGYPYAQTFEQIIR